MQKFGGPTVISGPMASISATSAPTITRVRAKMSGESVTVIAMGAHFYFLFPPSA